tara:strand:- start:99 stop:608 length:510 start_codon:yes stop_codon:yes gene_type:complete
MDFISAIKRLQGWLYPVEKIEREILDVSKTINALSSDRGVNIEGKVYQYFPSKADALDFAKRWTRGSDNSFTVEHIDVDRLDIKFYSRPCNISVFREDHPNFDPKDRGGILHQTPALFFGMETASNEQGEDYYDLWFYDFCKLKLSWLKEYRDHLINEKRSLVGNNKDT